MFLSSHSRTALKLEPCLLRSLKPHVPQFWDPQRADPEAQDLQTSRTRISQARGPHSPGARVPQAHDPSDLPEASRPGGPLGAQARDSQTPGMQVLQAPDPQNSRHVRPSDPRPHRPPTRGSLRPGSHTAPPPRLAHLPRGLTRAGQCG